MAKQKSKKKLFRITEWGKRFIYLTFGVFLLLDILSKFDVLPNVRNIAGIVGIPLVVSLFILIEIKFVQLIKKKKKLGAVESLGFASAIITLLLTGLVVAGISGATMLSILGVAEIAALAYALIELFRGSE